MSAVKIVPKSEAPTALSPLSSDLLRARKTLGEIEVLQKLNHPNTVKLLEVIEDNEFVYIFLEYWYVTFSDASSYLTYNFFLY